MKLYNDEILVDCTITDTDYKNFTVNVSAQVWHIETTFTNWSIRRLQELNFN